MSYKEDYIKEHKQFVKAQADKYTLEKYPPGTKIEEEELENYFRQFYDQYYQLEKTIKENENTIIYKAMQDGGTDVLELERELAYISHRQLEDYRELYKPH